MKYSLTILSLVLLPVFHFAQINTCDNSSFLCNKNPVTVSGLALCEESHAGMNDTSCIPERPQAYGKWFKWIISDGGSLTFRIDPLNPEDDIDFAVYRSNSPDCTNMNIERCMASGINYSLPLHENFPCMGSTGLRSQDTDTREDLGCLSSSNNYLSPLECATAEVYYLLVQNISDTTGFTISFGGSAAFLSSIEEFENLPTMKTFSITTIDKDFCEYKVLSDVTERNKEKITVFPNPATDLLKWELESTMPVSEVAILNIQGQKLILSKDTNSRQLDISRLAPGAYILRIQTDKSYHYQVWVKL